MSNVIKHYRDSKNGDAYTIEFQRESDGTYTLWALQSPSNPYRGSVTEHHLYDSGEICIAADAKPRTLDRAIALGVYWMNRYSVFVRTGHFPKTVGHVNV